MQEVDLNNFQKLNKNGVPYDILDDKIAEYVAHEWINMIVLNGQPYLYKNGYYRHDEDGKLLKAHIKELIWPDLITISRINRVYNLILADYRLSKKNEDVNAYPVHWVNFKNGMYDPVSKMMREHDPKYYSLNQIPHEFDPNAAYKNTVAEQFFNGLIPDMMDREMFFAFAGYCMTIDTRLQKFMVIKGIPGSGKSTAINMLVSAVGNDNVSCITLQDLNERFFPTELLGKLLNACADLPKTALEQVDAVKRITGEDLIKGEYKGGKVFGFRSYAKLLYSTNDMPVSLDEKSDAFFRRILMIEVKQKGPRIDGLTKGLEYSMPGFIKECMDALSRLYGRGGQIDSPNSQKLVQEYHRESDSVQAFLDDCIEFKQGSRIERGTLHTQYELYCADEDWPALNNRGFFKNLRGKGFRDYKSNDGRRYFKNMCPKEAEKCRYTADFVPASAHEKLPFLEEN